MRSRSAARCIAAMSVMRSGSSRDVAARRPLPRPAGLARRIAAKASSRHRARRVPTEFGRAGGAGPARPSSRSRLWRAARRAARCRDWCSVPSRRRSPRSARRMRCPTLSWDRRSWPGRRCGGAFEMCDLHAVAGSMPVHIAGFQRIEFSPAGGEKCGLYLGSGRRGSLITHRQDVGGTAARRHVFRKSSAMAHAILMSATLCSPRQAGFELTSKHLQLAIRRADQIDAGIIGIDGAHRGHRDSRHLGIGKHGRGLCRPGGCWSPSLRLRRVIAATTRCRVASTRQSSKTPSFGADIVLHVIHVVDGLRRPEARLRRDQADAFALASEQRLHHQRAIEPFGILKCMRQRFA